MSSDKATSLSESISSSIESLATMTDQAAKSEMFKQWLKSVSRFHQYSFGNSLLILLQRPDATRVAGFNTWKALGRNVKKGSKGIAILAPCMFQKKVKDEVTGETTGTVARLGGFRVTHVFSYEDTEGKELPELRHRATEGGEELLPRLEAAARRMGITVEYHESAGGANGYSEGGKVVILSSLSTPERCGTLAHELAHEYLHWETSKLDSSRPFTLGRTPRREKLTREQRELEAEATSYALLSQFGIEQPSQNYLASWDADADAIHASLQIIRDAVHHIMDAMEQDQTAEEEAAAIAA